MSRASLSSYRRSCVDWLLPRIGGVPPCQAEAFAHHFLRCGREAVREGWRKGLEPGQVLTILLEALRASEPPMPSRSIH